MSIYWLDIILGQRFFYKWQESGYLRPRGSCGFLSLGLSTLLWHRQHRNKGGACPRTSSLTDTDGLALAHPALGTPLWRSEPSVRTAVGTHCGERQDGGHSDSESQ